MLKRIKITGFKSFKNVEVKLGKLAVIIGPNATGKSNFLDALQLLSRIATCEKLTDAFDSPFRGKPLESFSYGKEGLEGLSKKNSVSLRLEVDVEISKSIVESVNNEIFDLKRAKPSDEALDSNRSQIALVREKFLRYMIEIEMDPQKGMLWVKDENLLALKLNGEPRSPHSRAPFLERLGKKLHLRMEKESHPLYFERYLSYSILSRSLHIPHYPHLTAMKRELTNWLFYYFEPRERMRTPNPVKESRHIGLMGEELAAFLHTLKVTDEKRFFGLKKALNALIPSITDIDTQVNKFGEVELQITERDVQYSSRLISEGTLRIIGLLALGSAKESPSLVGLEEPENGIHPRRIRLIAKYLCEKAAEDTQFIVTTHSPTLPNYIPDKDLYICHFIDDQSEIIPFITLGPLYKSSEVNKGLDDEPMLTKEERILRGDFDL